MTTVTSDFRFAKFDIGGKNAVAGDGKLTGQEVERAQRAGYSVWEGYEEKDGIPAEMNAKGYAIGAFTRDAALVDNKACQVGAMIVDVLLSPITFPISMIQGVVQGVSSR